MACRRTRQPTDRETHSPNNVDHLTFKYMEMCKMESSTESDSEISPRWSDTSTMGCVSSAPESSASRSSLPSSHKPSGRHGLQSLFLDPYDGSSEDSDESRMEGGTSCKPTRAQMKSGGCRLVARSRRFAVHQPSSVALKETMRRAWKDSLSHQHLADVQMNGGSESEGLDPPEEPSSHMQTMDVELALNPAGWREAKVKGGSHPLPCSSSDRSHSPCDLRCFYKRKLGLPAEDVVEMKRQCLFNAEAEHMGQDSASTPG